MQFYKHLSALLLSACLVTAGGKPEVVLKAMNAIADENQALYKLLADWNGDVAQAPALTDQTLHLHEVTVNVTQTIKTDSPMIGDLAALKLNGPLGQLNKATDKTLDTIEKAKAKFDAISLSGEVVKNLEAQRAAAADMFTVVVTKLKSSMAKSIGKNSGKNMDSLFDRAIKKYQ